MGPVQAGAVGKGHGAQVLAWHTSPLAPGALDCIVPLGFRPHRSPLHTRPTPPRSLLVLFESEDLDVSDPRLPTAVSQRRTIDVLPGSGIRLQALPAGPDGIPR